MADVPREGESIYPRSRRADYKIDPDTGCWVWQKFLMPYGYPSARAHRLYYQAAYGPIEPGTHVHHACRNRACVNPRHLRAFHPREHHIHHHLDERGLSFEQLEEIRRLGSVPGICVHDVARDFGVTHVTIYRYWNRKVWRDDFGEPVERPSWPCGAPDCDELVRGHRHKVYCSSCCRTRTNERKRRRRAQAAASTAQRQTEEER